MLPLIIPAGYNAATVPMDDLKAAAAAILQQHGHPADNLQYLGAGAQSVCYGAGDLALLIRLGDDEGDVRPLNPYPTQQWLTAQAAAAGVKTAAILVTGDHLHPYALMRRAPGTTAADLKEASPAQVAAWFRQLGAEVHKINQIQTTGFGEFVPADQPADQPVDPASALPGQQAAYRGRYATWGAYLDACIAKYLFMGPLTSQARGVRDLFLAQGIATGTDLAKVAARLEAAKRWDVQPVLVHYDNRLANLIISGGPDGDGDGDSVTLVDWGLAYAGIGLPQELIKVTEAPPAPPPYDPMAAFLQGYGVPTSEWDAVTDQGTLMLVLDGLAMSYAWALDLVAKPALLSSQNGSLPGIRGWLQSIHRICSTW